MTRILTVFFACGLAIGAADPARAVNAVAFEDDNGGSVVNTYKDGLTAGLGDLTEADVTIHPATATDVAPGSPPGMVINPAACGLLEGVPVIPADGGAPYVIDCDGEAGRGVTPGLVLHAFRRIPLPPSELIIQPPDGKTLVNFDTNFYVESAPFDRSVTLLGQRVDLHITPSAFTWHHGDGTSRTTTEPGAPYPALDVTHTYLKKGVVSPSVDTTYSAVFRVNGGAWQPVPGVVTIPGAPKQLRVVEASPQLVGY